MDLEIFRRAYDNGKPLISDDHYDHLVYKYGGPEGIGTPGDVAHDYRLYSLQKVFDNEKAPSTTDGHKLIETPKLDGSAISLLYNDDGYLVRGLTRGNGIMGKDITDKVLLMDSIPNNTNCGGIQIVGEVLFVGKADNQRNMSAGSLFLKDMEEFKLREKDLKFVCYSNTDIGNKTYVEDMELLSTYGFETVLYLDKTKYLTDGTVFRINDNSTFYNLGYTNKYPRGAFARKIKSDVEIKETKLIDIVWQTGSTGKVTPKAVFEEIIIDGAKITKATLHNVSYVEQLDLDLGDIILITRSGGVIPKILGNLTKGLYLYD